MIIKIFESFNSKKMIEEDIIGALVYLFDEGYDANIRWLDDDSFDLEISKDDRSNFNTDEVEDSLIFIRDLIYNKWSDYKCRSIFLVDKINQNTLKSKEYPSNKEVNILRLYLQREPIYEAFSYSESDYVSEVERILKSYDLRPTQINDIISFYQDKIEEYKEDGKVPQVFVNDIRDIINLDDSGNMFQMKVPSRPPGIMLKYL
jgi:hypothetical protein